MTLIVDTTFDVYSDTPLGRDPDSHSATLRQFHQSLWSKRLPTGAALELTTRQSGSYLHHLSALGEFHLSSDAIGATYKHVKAMAPIVNLITEDEMGSFFKTCSTVGAYTLFPSKRVNMKPTINGARGMHHNIRDRFDLTLECIRSHYEGINSPLAPTLERYRAFFELFVTFKGYVEFFLFQDFVDLESETLRFFTPFRHFQGSPLPRCIEEYRLYKLNLTRSVEARNLRIAEYCANAG